MHVHSAQHSTTCSLASLKNLWQGSMSILQNSHGPLLILLGFSLISKAQTKAIDHYQNSILMRYSDESLTNLAQPLHSIKKKKTLFILWHYWNCSGYKGITVFDDIQNPSPFQQGIFKKKIFLGDTSTVSSTSFTFPIVDQFLL